MNKEKFGLADNVEIVVRHADGSIKSKHEFPKDLGLFHALLVKLRLRHNSITKYGMAIVAGLITSDVGETAFDIIGIGTGTNAASVDDDDLQTSKKKKASTGTRVTTTQTNDTMQLVATFSSADGLSGTDVITEVGVFNALTGTQKILFRIVYSPGDSCNWDQGDTLQVTAKCQIKQGS